MVKSIFRVMESIESTLLRQYILATDVLNSKGKDKLSSAEAHVLESKPVFDKLVSFVETHCFTESFSEGFICENWKLNSDELAKLWIYKYPDRRSKAPATFRTMIRNLTGRLYGLLKLDETSLNDMFIVPAKDSRDNLVRIDDMCEYADTEDLNLDNMFSPTLINYVSNLDTDKTFEVKDCMKEVQLFKLMSNLNLMSLFESCDKDKLSYVAQRLRAPLFYMGSGCTVTKKGKSIFTPYTIFNEEKLEIFKFFKSIDALQLKEAEPVEEDISDEDFEDVVLTSDEDDDDFDEIDTNIVSKLTDALNSSDDIAVRETLRTVIKSEEVVDGIAFMLSDLNRSRGRVEEPAVSVDEGVSVDEEVSANPYSLELTEPLYTVLSKGLDGWAKAPEGRRRATSDKMTDESIERVKHFLAGYTELGFREILRRLNYSALEKVVNENYLRT